MRPQLEMLEIWQFDRDSIFCVFAEVSKGNGVYFVLIVHSFAAQCQYGHISKPHLRLLTIPSQWSESIQWVRNSLSGFHWCGVCLFVCFCKTHCGDSC